MEHAFNYAEIDKKLMKVSCPNCQSFPVEISTSNMMFGIEVNCGHDEFLTKLTEEYIKLKKEQRVNPK